MLQATLLALCRLENEKGGRRTGSGDGLTGRRGSVGGKAGKVSGLMHAAVLRGRQCTVSPTGELEGEMGTSETSHSAGASGECADEAEEAEKDAVMQPSAPILDHLEQVLASSHEWQFDAFELAKASQGHPLSTLAFYLFHQHGLISNFRLSPAPLARFLRRVEEGYKQNPYHNATHASDVLQTLNTIIHRGGLVPGYVDPLYLMAALLSAVSLVTGQGSAGYGLSFLSTLYSTCSHTTLYCRMFLAGRALAC
jgi:hypothetical protein